MITKFKSIKNLAVFQDFIWDDAVKNQAGQPINFKAINIIYGRNYSGKTTLSRIIKALEDGRISEKYNHPEFEITIDNNLTINQNNLLEHRKKVRVFNEDFIKENLRFIIDQEASINSFAILGGNTSIEIEIEDLRSTLGTNENGKESGMYLDLKNAILAEKTTKNDYDSQKKILDQQLISKATDKQTGIKYKSHLYGDQNYTKPKLEDDIKTVLDSSFQPLSDGQIEEKKELLGETVKTAIPQLSKTSININEYNSKAAALVCRTISSSDKIEQLVKDAVLNRWAKHGKDLHKDKLKECAFCGNKISEERWQALDSHYDEESDKLEEELSKLIEEIQTEITRLDTTLNINKISYYSKFHHIIDRLQLLKQYIVAKLKDQLQEIINQLIERKNDLLNPKSYSPIPDNCKRLELCWQFYEKIRQESNSYSSQLAADQFAAKEGLRLKEVFVFVKTIHYVQEVVTIEELKRTAVQNNEAKVDVQRKVDELNLLIEQKQRLMNDEGKGALKVNEYLNNFFGHNSLSLKALEEAHQVNGKKIRFEVIREGKKAYHLSEGECSLIAFCYFMAKLEDIDTKGTRPIIWIDDPISSLDSNHIFFIYSLIDSELVIKNNFEQLFISTHNLDFFKYLKRLKTKDIQREYFVISREMKYSRIKPMPKYLKTYVTEFNFLFHQIYKCANAQIDDDDQHALFYNFANNARKFLEAFLFYKYPNAIEKDEKLARFFDGNHQASGMTERVNNEYSHLEGLFERSMRPIDVPEMNKTAKFILRKIEEKDKEQYEALLISIGENKQTPGE